jgi:hypothetical protein
MDEQVRRGDEVAYFFSGRQYPLARDPRLRRWERGGATMLEVVNSPLFDHGRQPELELSEPRVERLLEGVLEELRPDAVHVQELAGLPTSVLDVVRSAGVPSIVTLQDYFPVCSTFKLLDAAGRVCTRLEIGADCAATIAADKQAPGLMIDATLKYHVRRMRLVRAAQAGPAPVAQSVRAGRVRGWIDRGVRLASEAEAARRSRAQPSPRTPAAFQRRRELNVERLNGADCVIAMSQRVAEIYERLGVDPRRLRTVHLTLAHIDRLRPRRAEAPAGRPLTFATLAGFESEAKGARLLIEAMRLLDGRVDPGSLRLLVFGYVDPHIRAAAAGVPGIEIARHFAPTELDAMLDVVDVGLMPSVWEEAYGYAGMEFLAKGIPVIANAIGGMPDYTREGETGWLNRSCSAAELADIVARVVERPKQIADLNRKLLAARDSIVKPMARHANEMGAIYEDAIAARSS